MPHTAVEQEKLPSSFDGRHPPEKKYIDESLGTVEKAEVRGSSTVIGSESYLRA